MTGHASQVQKPTMRIIIDLSILLWIYGSKCWGPRLVAQSVAVLRANGTICRQAFMIDCKLTRKRMQKQWGRREMVRGGMAVLVTILPLSVATGALAQAPSQKPAP